MAGPQLTRQCAADAVRGRLLVTDYGNPTGLWSVIVPDPGTGAQLSVSDPVRLRVTKASIAIATTGQIWLGGFDTGDGVFMQLDPQTLEPVLHSPSDKKLEPGAVVVAAGYRSLWIRASGGDYLLCMDAVTGAERQAWTVSGGVASTNGRAVVGTARGVVAAHLRGCPG